MSRWRVAAAAVAGLLLLAGCGGGERIDVEGELDTPGLAVDVPADDVPDEFDEAPEECADAYPQAYLAADIADVEVMPVDWPEPPAGSTLCITSDTVGGGVEAASYANELVIDEILAHYESALSGSYELTRTGGDETGTGYDTLDGVRDDLSFQIREHDGGFVIVFASEAP